MAEQRSVVEDYLTCAVCLETFKEPVSLSCHHSFCCSCLSEYWRHNDLCPVCRRRSTRELEVNFALKELSLSFKEERTSVSDTQHPEVCPRHPQVCPRHPGVPPLFCKEERRLLCPVCEFSKHKEHTVVSVEEAEAELKEHLSLHLQSLKDHREHVHRQEQKYEEIQAHSDRQLQETEAHIRAVFRRLQTFLKEQEELSVSALKQEQHRQTQTLGPELQRTREQLSSVDLRIQALEEQLHRTRESFLLTYSPPQSLQQGALLPPLGKGLLINQAGLLGNLGFRVWEKMRDIVQYCPVVLDPNTALSVLQLSEDLTSVRAVHKDNRIDLTENPERFRNFPIVLGSEGFTSGTHSWDVEVGDHPHWVIGVVKDTVDRIDRSTVASPEKGFWDLVYLNDHYYTTARGTLNFKGRPEKVRVVVDYSRGTVSFFDSSDMSHILTHRTTFTEKIFPYFSIGIPGENKTKDIRICPRRL